MNESLLNSSSGQIKINESFNINKFILSLHQQKYITAKQMPQRIRETSILIGNSVHLLIEMLQELQIGTTKSCIRETLYLLTCADSSNNTKNLKPVTCHLSPVTFHLSPFTVTFHLSPVFNANSHSHRPSPSSLCTVEWFTKIEKNPN